MLRNFSCNRKFSFRKYLTMQNFCKGILSIDDKMKQNNFFNKRFNLNDSFISNRMKHLQNLLRCCFQKLEDLDIPPHIFHLSDSIDIDPNVGRLLNRLPLTSLGFRHYNSAVLFQYIEFRMPHHIRLLRSAFSSFQQRI